MTYEGLTHRPEEGEGLQETVSMRTGASRGIGGPIVRQPAAEAVPAVAQAQAEGAGTQASPVAAVTRATGFREHP